MVGTVGALVSFKKGSDLLAELSGVFYQGGDARLFALHPMPDQDRFRVGGLTGFRLQFGHAEGGEVVELVGQYESGRTDVDSKMSGAG